MGVDIIVSVLAARIDAVILVIGLRHMSLIECHHICVDLVYIGGVGKVHHVGRVASRRAHVDFQSCVLALLAQSLAGLGQSEELKVYETSVNAELFGGLSADLAKSFRNVRIRVVLEIQVVIDDLHDGSRPCRHVLEQGLKLGVEDGLIGDQVADNELLHDVRNSGKIVIERVQLLIVVELPGVICTYADIRLNDHGIAADLIDKSKSRLAGRHFALSGSGNAGFLIELLHQGLLLDEADAVRLNTCCDVEIRAQARILLQPVLVEGFDPVDLSVLEGEESDCSEYLVIVLE